ncbi:PIR protein [Plasmodium vivax]|nr:PIR protein [Plasmodium vivax]
MATASEEKWEGVLKELPSSKIYAKFNNDTGVKDYTCIHYKICEEIKNNYDGLENFCKKFEKSLNDISKPKVTTAAGSANEEGGTHGPAGKDKPEEIGNFKDNCLLLKYWVFDEINKMKNNKGTNVNIIPVIDKLDHIQYYLNKKNNKNVCHNNYYEYTNYSKEEKMLYEYFKDFDAIKNYINSVKKEEKTFREYINKIIEIYKKKKDENHCCHKNYDLCYSYFQCDPKYDPSNLLLLLDKVKKLTQKASDESGQTSDTEQNANPLTTKYRTTIHNVKCLINYGARNDGYAFLSCYNIGKGYPNVEHIFTPTEEEKKKASEELGKDPKVSEDNEQARSELLAQDDSKLQSAASDKGGRVAKSTTPKIGIPESLKGYTFLGEYVRREAKENYGKYQLGRRIAQLFSGIGNTNNAGNTEIKVNCSNSRIKEGKVICVNLEDKEEKYVYENGIITGSNSSSAAASSGMFNQEFQSNLLDTDYFRIGSVPTLLLGFSFVFFLYFKFSPLGTWLRNRFSRKRKFRREIPEEYLRDMPPSNPSRPQKKVPPQRKVRIAYHAS